jgi:hypothetical protein
MTVCQNLQAKKSGDGCGILANFISTKKSVYVLSVSPAWLFLVATWVGVGVFHFGSVIVGLHTSKLQITVSLVPDTGQPGCQQIFQISGQSNY